MKLSEYSLLKSVESDCDRIYVSTLDQTNRTLLYGYTCDRNTWHVYLLNGTIYRLMYDYKNELIEHKQYQNYISISEVIPDKRLYPSACCYQFCTMIASKGGYLPFTTWDDRYDDGFGFYGLTLNDFKVF